MARVNVPVTDLSPPKATLTTAMGGTLNDLVVTAKKGGPGGNSIQLALIVSGASTPLSVDVEGYLITVNVETSSGSAAVSTAGQVRNAILAASDAAQLVDVDLVDAGTGVVTALTATSLAGGAWEVTPPAEVNGDATNGHVMHGNTGIEFVELRNSGASTRTVTLYYAPSLALGAVVAAATFTIAAGASRKLGGLKTTWFNQNADGDVWFDVSHADLKLLAYRPVQG